MFLRYSCRKKDGKEHRYWSIVENKRVGRRRVVQRYVLYLGEINSSQELAWRKSIEVFQDGEVGPRTVALFPEDRCKALISDESIVRVRLSELRLCRPRQWGACWLVVKLWRELELDRFWGERLLRSRKGTRWDQVFLVLVAYRLIAPGSEWRLHRQWFGNSALSDLLGADFELADSHKLYACHDLLLKHKQALFDHLVNRWRDLFNATFEVLLYDLTSTYFESDPPIQYLVGPPKGRLNRLENQLLDKPWYSARPGVLVKLLPQQGELYLLAHSADRVAKERAIRRRQLKWLWARLKQLSAMMLTREQLLMKLGAAKQKVPSAWRLIEIEVAKQQASFTYRLHRQKLRSARRREGRYLLRTNLTETDPAKLWSLYLQLVAVEEAFKNLKGDLAIRPIFHQHEQRIEAHIFVSFLAYCVHVTLTQRLRTLAPGLTARSVLEKFAAVQMIDVHLPTTDGRELTLTRYSQPEPELQLLLDKLKLELPPQFPPKISAAQATSATAL